ncbi:MAG: hypothetical protein QXM86_01465 [Candidatus Bathyarchaeia archaeon]
MPKTFMMKLDKIQPTQLFISSEKLSEVMKTFNSKNPKAMDPIPIKKLGNEIIFVDGHTRAFAAFLYGFSEIPVYWEDEELDWDEYKICLKWCKKEKIHTIADLKSRVVSQKDYERLWYKRCEEMQQNLEWRRKQKSAKKKLKTV